MSETPTHAVLTKAVALTLVILLAVAVGDTLLSARTPLREPPPPPRASPSPKPVEQAGEPAARPPVRWSSGSAASFVAALEAGAETSSDAQEAIAALEEELTAAGQGEPLSAEDAEQIERRLKGWLIDRRKIDCGACAGKGTVRCTTCSGTGLLSGRTGGPMGGACTHCKRGRRACASRFCASGLDLRTFHRAVFASRPPRVAAEVGALLGEAKGALGSFLRVAAAIFRRSPRAAFLFSRACGDLEVSPGVLKELVAAIGLSPELDLQFKSYTRERLGRTVVYTLSGGPTTQRERAHFGRVEGEWYLLAVELEEAGP